MIRLSDHIASSNGWLSLERFMEIALYDPEDGYYSASIQNVGVRGDFSTASTMSPLLARGIMNEWKKACKKANTQLPIIEIGAGNASLALSFMEALGFWGRLKVRYHIVESSEPLGNLQRLALGSAARVHDNMETALKACKGKAFIFSNELVDAFPARVFEQADDGWMEVGLSIKDGAIVEVIRPIVNPPRISTALECTTETGQRVEVHDSYHQWFLSWLPHWKSGVMTTIDYGDELEQLYYRRPKGTMRAYFKHQMLTGMDVYERPGRQDLTADVNFSDLLLILEQCLGDKISLITQRDYLMPYVSETSEDSYLTQKYGPGDHFKVLIQQRLPR